MQVLVCIKQILDPEIPSRQFEVDRAAKRVIPGDAALVINPFDANAVEISLQLKSRRKDCMVTALTLGGETCGKALRHVLAMGCDEAVWLKDPLFEGLDSSGIARTIAAGIRKRGPVDLVLCGRQAGDWDMGQVGSLVAEELSLACVTVVSQVEVRDGRLRLRREAEKGEEVLESSVPVLATVTSSSLGDSFAVFEPIHGTAPKYADKNVVNPIAAIRAAMMMLDYIGEKAMAGRVEGAISEVLVEGKVRTYDLGGSTSTMEMAEAIAGKLDIS